MALIVAGIGLSQSGAVRSPRFSLRPLAELGRYGVSYRDAARYWGWSESKLVAVELEGERCWDDLVDAGVADRERLTELAQPLEALASTALEMAMWWAGFPDEVPVVETPHQFVREVLRQVEAGAFEPACRLRRRPSMGESL